MRLATLLTTAGFQDPVNPLSEVSGKAGTVPPVQMVSVGPPKLKVGVTVGLTITVNVSVTAHSPTLGVKIYFAEFRSSITDGLHVPVIPSVDVNGKGGTKPPAQMVSAVPKLKVGVTFGLTVTVSVVRVSQNPGFGVNVYTPEI